MAEWSAPKTDWNPNDGLSDTDFNRIEGDIENLYDTIVISGQACGHAAAVGEGLLNCIEFLDDTVKDFQIVKVEVPAGHELYVKKARYAMLDTEDAGGFRLRVKENTGGIIWASASAEGDEAPLVSIYENSTGSAVDVEIAIQAKSPFFGTHYLYMRSGWSVELLLLVNTTTTTTAGA